MFKTGSGIRKRKVEVCTDVQTAAVNDINAKRQRLETSQGQTAYL